MLLTLAAVMVGIMVLRADLWMHDAEIVQAWEIPRASGNWLPVQLWSLSKWLGGETAWAYRVWNIGALWMLGLVVFVVAEEFLGPTGSGDVWSRRHVALFAALLVICHPLSGMGACEIANLDWQLAVLFSLLTVGFMWKFIRLPVASMMLGILVSTMLAALSAPTGLLLSLGGSWVVWCLAAKSERQASKNWIMARTGWGTGLSIVGILMLIWLGSGLQASWTRHSLSQGTAWTAHWLTQGRVFLSQLQTLFRPTVLLPEHHLAWSESWRDWPAVTGLCVVAIGCLTCAIKLWRKRPSPLCALVFLALWPTLLVLGWRTTNLLSEIRWYAVLPWAAILAAWSLGWLLNRWPAMSLPIGWGLPIGLMFLSLGQSARFADATTMAAHILEAEPCQVEVRNFVQEKQATNGNLAAVLSNSRPFADAYQIMSIANENDPYGRRYDLLEALHWWVLSERRAQNAMESNYGTEYARAFSSASTARFFTEVQKLSQTEPKALPLLAALLPSLTPQEPSKPRPSLTIPGVPPTTAQGDSDSSNTVLPP